MRMRSLSTLSASPVLRGAIPQMALDSSVLNEVSTSLAFADTAGTLAGQFFQYSLLPYVGFLYFLNYPANKTPKVANFGFQFLLLFVLSTVFTGIVTKSVYSSSLANVDWLHGAAEALLTCSNLYVGFGFRAAIAGEKEPEGVWSWRSPALALFAAVAAATAVGPTLGLGAHDAFLFGVGALPPDLLANAPLAAEPVNALSVPTWAIHFSSVFEWLFAMGMVWQFASVTGNEKWKGLTWGMLPLHASGIAACTYHFFYNAPEVSFLVAVQAGLTLLGNTTVCLAALRIALSNGWQPKELLPSMLRGEEADGPAASEAEDDSAVGLTPRPEAVPSLPFISAELILLTAISAIGLKYGELLIPLPFEPNAIVAAGLVVAIPAVVSNRFMKLPAADGA